MNSAQATINGTSTVRLVKGTGIIFGADVIEPMDPKTATEFGQIAKD